MKMSASFRLRLLAVLLFLVVWVAVMITHNLYQNYDIKSVLNREMAPAHNISAEVHHQLNYTQYKNQTSQLNSREVAKFLIESLSVEERSSLILEMFSDKNYLTYGSGNSILTKSVRLVESLTPPQQIPTESKYDSSSESITTPKTIASATSASTTITETRVIYTTNQPTTIKVTSPVMSLSVSAETHKVLMEVSKPVWDTTAFSTVEVLSEGENSLPNIPLAKVQCRSKPKFRIPNIIHHIWFGTRKFKFYHYISLRSAALIQQPDAVYVYINEAEPQGPYWKRYREEVPCVNIRKIEAPTSIFNHTIKVVEHKADVARLQILMDHGGIYLDTDTVVIKPFDPLLNESCVLGEEIPGAYGNGIILAEKNSTFLHFWFNTYKTFNDSQWATHSIFMPARIHREHQEFPFHLEKKTFLRPNWSDGMKYFESLNYNISDNYCVHLYASKTTLQLTEREIAGLNATFGTLARVALYGKRPLMNV